LCEEAYRSCTIDPLLRDESQSRAICDTYRNTNANESPEMLSFFGFQGRETSWQCRDRMLMHTHRTVSRCSTPSCTLLHIGRASSCHARSCCTILVPSASGSLSLLFQSLFCFSPCRKSYDFLSEDFQYVVGVPLNPR